MRANTICWLLVTGLAIAGSLASADQPAPRDAIPMDGGVDCSDIKEHETTVHYRKGDEVKAWESGYREHMGRYRCKEANSCYDGEPRKYPDVWEHRGTCKK